MNFMQDFSFEEEQNSPEYEKVQKALLKAMKELKILLNESEENLLIGQYENYLKSFAFLNGSILSIHLNSLLNFL